MADYSCIGRRNATNGSNRTGFRFQPWGLAKGSGAENTDGWNRPGFLSKPEANRDHVRRPVIVGADGRTTSGVLECPPNHHKTETVTENAYGPHSQPAFTRDYVFGNGRDQGGGLSRGEAKKASESGGMGLFHRAKANHNTNGINANRWVASEPALITKDGWTRPNRAGWTLPPDVPLGKVTNDVDAAADYLRGSARPPTDHWSSASSPAYQARKKEVVSTTTTIDSREAAKRYGGKFIW